MIKSQILKRFLISLWFVKTPFLFPIPVHAHNGNWAEGIAWISFFLFTAFEVILIAFYLIIRKALNEDHPLRIGTKFVLIIISLFYLLGLSNHFYYFIFKLNNKGIINKPTYLFFIYFFILNLYLIRWSKGNKKKIRITQTLFMFFLVLFFSWLISPRIQVYVTEKNYWDLPFGSGLWGAMNAGYFLFHPISVPLLFGLIVWFIYFINGWIYKSFKKHSLVKIRRISFQLIISISLAFLLMGLFEPRISGPIPKSFVLPKLKTKRGDSYNALRWAEYYGFNISREEILGHPQYVNAFMRRANRRVKNGDYEKALSDFMRIHNIFSEKGVKPYLNFNQITYNLQVGWLLSTCPIDKIRDGRKAIELITDAISLYGLDLIEIPVDQIIIEQKKYTDWRKDTIMNVKILQILAAAYAETSNFVEARRVQEKALNLLLIQSRKDYEDGISILNEQLQNYMNNIPWRNLSRSISPIYF